MKYQIVIAHGRNGTQEVLDLSEDQLFPALEIRGIKFTKLSTNRALRAELQGQPMFDKLCGPMWGGEGVVRYENQDAYDFYSA